MVTVGRELKDPRIGFTTITRVAITDDLSYARVFASVMGSPDEKKQTMHALKKSAGFIRRRLGQILTIRAVPEIHFKLDENAEYAIRIGKLLDEIHQDDPDDSEPSDA